MWIESPKAPTKTGYYVALLVYGNKLKPKVIEWLEERHYYPSDGKEWQMPNGWRYDGNEFSGVKAWMELPEFDGLDGHWLFERHSPDAAVGVVQEMREAWDAVACRKPFRNVYKP